MHLHRRAAFAALLLALGLFLVLGSIRQEAQALEAEDQQLLELINGYRQANGVGPLVPSEILSVAAKRHSEDMATYGFLSHSTEASSYYPVGSGYVDRVAQEGYPMDAYIAENLAWGQATAEEVFEFWRLSPDHNANMLNENYTSVGIGHVDPYWTADFGSVAAP